MTEKIIIAGFGGQGIMLMGKVLAEAAMLEGKNVTWLPAYGAEVRGGTANCMVVVSDEPIGSPFIDRADSLIIMNGPSLARFQGRLKDKGLIVINSSLAQAGPDTKGIVAGHPFSDIAVKLGGIKVANIAALGFFAAKTKLVSVKSLTQVIIEMTPRDKKELGTLNLAALSAGAELEEK
jgi:2-oxoglutarate ferredoxin oxidoreductase subunit gamma